MFEDVYMISTFISLNHVIWVVKFMNELHGETDVTHTITLQVFFFLFSFFFLSFYYIVVTKHTHNIKTCQCLKEETKHVKQSLMAKAKNKSGKIK